MTFNNLCYVCAPVNGEAFDDCRARNQSIAARLRLHGLVPVDPLDFPRSDELAGQVGDLDETAKRLGLTNDEQIVYGCLDKLEECSNVLVVIDSPVFTVGTIAELTLAWKRGKNVVAVLGPGVRSAWLNVMTKKAGTIEEAIQWLQTRVLAART